MLRQAVARETELESTFHHTLQIILGVPAELARVGVVRVHHGGCRTVDQLHDSAFKGVGPNVGYCGAPNACLSVPDWKQLLHVERNRMPCPVYAQSNSVCETDVEVPIPQQYRVSIHSRGSDVRAGHAHAANRMEEQGEGAG